MGIIVGITPARGSSKRLPGKNIRMIAGKPLLAWTIEAAKKVKQLDRYIVSTEDKEIARISDEFGAEVLFRPPQLADDQTSTLNVLQHVIKYVSCDIIVLLQATSPVRSHSLISECIAEFNNNEYDSLATGFMCKYIEYGKNDLRSQDIKGFFYDDGNVYIIRADLIRKGERFGNKIGRKIISPWENIDIDDEFDFWVAEKILKENRLDYNFA